MKSLLLEIEKEIKNRGILEDQIAEVLSKNRDIVSRRIIGGYSSVDLKDREGQRIPILTLNKVFPRFMENVYYRPINIFHSDLTIGRVLPKWTNPETGETFTTHINDIGFWILAEIRDDVEIANKTWDEMVKGNIRSFSIAGSSKDKVQKQVGIESYEQINDMDLLEITCCEVPVNSMSKFDILFNPQQVFI